ncbi:hypothetical protein B296_00046629 [Ensete ventricosum]|uniref:Uncharacterized protein n=1 Tax=Ensete ventricosum TaxID=4639 RepID=A0A426YJG2_ENSVE|nr:hypothetical protein B296_00046629 [Ensete ventricosum]
MCLNFEAVISRASVCIGAKYGQSHSPKPARNSWPRRRSSQCELCFCGFSGAPVAFRQVEEGGAMIGSSELLRTGSERRHRQTPPASTTWNRTSTRDEGKGEMVLSALFIPLLYPLPIWPQIPRLHIRAWGVEVVCFHSREHGPSRSRIESVKNRNRIRRFSFEPKSEPESNRCIG